MIRAAALLLGLSCAAGFAYAASGDDLTTANMRAPFVQPFAFVEARGAFKSGGDLFRLPWFDSQSGDQGRFGGLGPLSNRFSCAGCHIGNGRGETSAGEASVMRSALVRLSVPGVGAHGEALPEPSYGDQLQPTGIYSVLGEGEASIRWNETERTLPDGTRVSLRAPELVFSRLHYGPMAGTLMTSIRMSPGVFGLGLLASVPDAALEALADPEDADHDGIRGRVNHVWNSEHGRLEIGRFGLKANQPSLRQQVASALIGDMGISSPLFPQQNCTAAEEACRHALPGRTFDISGDDLSAIVSYVEALAPPARRAGASERGETLFRSTGCASCHKPELTAGEGPFPQIAGRAFHPYTDLLLHDMGDGLADNRPDFEASGRDWRTAPLWGIGLAGAALEHPTYLHDGRARDLIEAVLWHGGEATKARDAFAALAAADRSAILDFLNSL